MQSDEVTLSRHGPLKSIPEPVPSDESRERGEKRKAGEMESGVKADGATAARFEMG